MQLEYESLRHMSLLQPAASVRGISKRMAYSVGFLDAKPGSVLSKPQTNERPQGNDLGDTLEQRVEVSCRLAERGTRSCELRLCLRSARTQRDVHQRRS